MDRRLSPGTLVFSACAAASWLAALAAGGATSGWDEAVFAALRQSEPGTLVDLAWAVTWLGDWLMLVPAAVTAAGYLLWRGKRTEALMLVATVAAVRILVSLQKAWLDRARPDVERWMAEVSNSFPSAHAANSLATYVAIAILLSGSRTAVGLAVALSAVVGTTRIILGVHWPSDVIGGWAFAMLALLPLWRFRHRTDLNR